MQVIDITRGLLIYWMVVAHALTLANIGKNSYLFYMRPQGWATTGFIMLSGFSLAIVFIGRGFSNSQLKYRLGRRAALLLAWALTTELLSRAVTDLRNPTVMWISLRTLFDPNKTWSISGFLLPTFIIYGICTLASIYMRVPHLTTFLSLTFLSASIVGEGFFIRSQWLISIFGAPIPLLTCLGFFGLGLGLASKRFALSKFLICVGITGSVFLLICSLHSMPKAVFIIGTFLITLGIGGILHKLPWITPLKKVLALMGRSSLLLFILHRFVLQIGAKLLPMMLIRQMFFITLLSMTLLFLIAICYIKEHNINLKKALKAAGL
jgi:hypothetical protein